MNTDRPLKKGITIAGLVVVILACWAWLYFSQIPPPSFNVPLHTGTGQALAEETAKLLNHKGQIVVIAISSRQFPELKAQLDSFAQALQQIGGVTIKERHIVAAHNPKYGVGRGLSAKSLLEVLKKDPDVDAIVSFIGVPELSDEAISQLSIRHPKFIAEVRSARRCFKLLDKGVLQLAVVSRLTFPAPSPKHPHSPREWFDHCFQIITPQSGQAASHAARGDASARDPG